MSDDTDHRDLLKGIAGAGVAVVLAGCAGGNDTETEAEETPTSGGEMTGTTTGGSGDMDVQARYGVLMPETGDLGSLGVTIRDGALLPAAQINDADVPVSVETSVQDTQTNPQTGISGAETLVNGGFPAVVGPASSNVNLQVTREVFIPNEVVGMSPSSTAPAVTQLEDNDYIFRTAPSDALQGPVMAQVAAERVGASSVSTLFLNDAYGQALEGTFADAIENEQDGVTLQNQVSFEAQQASYTSQLSDALQDDPDALMIVGFPQSGIQLFSDYYNNFDSSNHTIVVPDGLIDDDLPDEVDNDFGNVVGTSPASAGPGQEFFNNAYNDEYGSSPMVFNAQAYDAGAVFILAAAAAAGAGNEITGQTIQSNIRTVANPGDGESTAVTPSNLAEGVELALDGESIDYRGASSPVDFDENGDMSTVTYGVFETQSRDFEQVDSITFGA